MTPIHPKDRPKVIAMSVLSVLMLGFFLMTVMGAISKKPGNAGLGGTGSYGFRGASGQVAFDRGRRQGCG